MLPPETQEGLLINRTMSSHATSIDFESVILSDNGKKWVDGDPIASLDVMQSDSKNW